MNITLPKSVNQIIRALERAGFEAYAVGGCVRDSLLSRTPGDWDITTSATPMQVKALFSHTIDTGIQHGTVTVMIEGEGYEVTTYRVDGEYEDCRHPKEVQFTPNLSEDLARRDFTINAMATNGRDGIVDLYGGTDDLEKRVIRAVGDPEERFKEDALRILRAYRFAAQLDFVIDPATAEAAGHKAQNLSRVSAERIRVELCKLLISGHPGSLHEAYLKGITGVVLPEFDTIEEDGADRAEKVLSAIKNNANYADSEEKTRLKIKWAILLSAYTDSLQGEYSESVAKDLARHVMTRLKFDNDTRDAVGKLVEKHRVLAASATSVAVRRLMREVGVDIFPLLLSVQASLLENSVFPFECDIHYVESIKPIYEEAVKRHDCVQIKDLAINGQDLLANGFEKGPGIGEVLDRLLSAVIDNPEVNNRETLLNLAKRG